jgi:hypothetical protein
MIFKAIDRLTREHRGFLVGDVQEAHHKGFEAEKIQGGKVATFPSGIVSR